jgi:hypothetical protein
MTARTAASATPRASGARARHVQPGVSRKGEREAGSFPYDPARVKVIACATVIEEMAPLMPSEMAREVLDFGLHLHPGKLTAVLQDAIDASRGFDAILLGYGLCSNAVVGLRATTAKLVVPRVDDCIAIFLGSRDAYRDQARREPGTYYLTKGWIEVGDSPFDEESRLAARYGEAQASRMVRLMLRNYRRVALINTGGYDIERCRAYARRAADRFGLRFEEIAGARTLIEKLLYGPWDAECLVVPLGGTIAVDAFLEQASG